MNKPVTVAMLEAGIIPKEVLQEMRHWGLPINFVEMPAVTLQTSEQVIDCIRDAVEGDDAVKIRDTDLDVLAHYLKHQLQGRLHLYEPDTDSVASVSVTYSVLPNGRYVFPWTNESITDMLTYSKSYLKVGLAKVRFDDVTELFFGGVKAFVSARPMNEDAI